MKLLRYLVQYRFADMAELLRNEARLPLDCAADLTGKTAVITGATSGIGLETARLFAARGAGLVLCNRDADKSAALEAELRAGYGVPVHSLITDFSSLARIKETGRALLDLASPIDILIHNAGVFYTRRTFTADGLEMVFQVNHLASFCLNYLLKEKLKRENRARIIYVNSEGHRFALAGVHLDDLEWRRHRYTGLKSYGAAKTAQLLAMLGFADYFAGSAVTVNAMHPGNVRSRIGENNGQLYRFAKEKFVLSSAKDPRISAQALHYLAAAADLAGVSGAYFNLTTREKPAPHAVDRTMVEPVWRKSLGLAGLA
jgi:NAD(P)-dependent dehydrogenase (short-subunit alcohol dehydrogenase family)